MDAKTAIQKIQQFNGLLDDELVGEISSLLQNQQAEIAKKDRMLDAAEKVCKLLESHYGTYLNHEYCKALKEWQEVGR